MSVLSYIFKILLPPYCLLSLILLPTALCEITKRTGLLWKCATQTRLNQKTMQVPRCPLSFLRPFSSYNYFSVINQILWATDDKKILTISSRHSVGPYCSLSLNLLAAALCELSKRTGLLGKYATQRNTTHRARENSRTNVP